MPKELNVSVSDDVYGALHREFSRIEARTSVTGPSDTFLLG